MTAGPHEIAEAEVLAAVITTHDGVLTRHLDATLDQDGLTLHRAEECEDDPLGATSMTLSHEEALALTVRLVRLHGRVALLQAGLDL